MTIPDKAYSKYLTVFMLRMDLDYIISLLMYVSIRMFKCNKLLVINSAINIKLYHPVNIL